MDEIAFSIIFHTMEKISIVWKIYGVPYPINFHTIYSLRRVHYCTKEGKEADVNNDWCPYIFFGPNRGKYRHPHIALSALETYLANKVMPSTCGTSWDDSNYPAEVDTTRAFPDMEGGFPDVDGLEAPEQPSIENGKWTWPGPEGAKRKPVVGNFATNLYIEENNNVFN